MTEPSDTAVFRLGYVPGVTPGKWARIWAERRPHVPLELVTATTDEAVELIRTGAVDAALVRLPIDRTGLHTIPLYTETTVAVVPKEHVVTATEEATVADLADEIVLRPQDDTLAWPGDRPGRAAAFAPATTAEASSVLMANGGRAIVIHTAIQFRWESITKEDRDRQRRAIRCRAEDSWVICAET